ncbi:MAG: HlyD family efflux transporter periplasmic adaptor subunit, partial [Ottowia sp.]|nr:HlyD family efflux transporter periplasmic adaptor subunit [Ottowia sp.]
MATSKKPIRKIVYWLLAAVALAALAWAAMREPVQLASTAPVTRGPLEVSFQEEGKTRLKQRYVVTAPVAGMVRRITLQPGDAVRAGRVLAEIEPATSQLLDPRSRSQAQADLRGAEAQLAAVRQRIGAAQSAERLAQTDLRRAETLQGAGAVSQEYLD